MGIRSENAAHRIAVEWDDHGQLKNGVYIPRRDTSSVLNVMAGGCIFPGKHHAATFTVSECGGDYKVAMRSRDGLADIDVAVRRSEQWGESSVFDNVEEASKFFEYGAVGYSPAAKGVYEGLELCIDDWHVSAMMVESVYSSYFSDRQVFPEGSVRLDCALLMDHIHHEWRTQGQIREAS